MLVNNFNIKNLGLCELTVDIQNSSLTNESEWLKKMKKPFMTKSDIGFKAIKVVLIAEGNSREEILNNVSSLVNKLLNVSVVKFNDYSHLFKVVLADEGDIEKTVDPCIYKKTINLCGYEYGQEVTEDLNNLTNVINVKGTMETTAIVEITPSVSFIDLEIEGLTEDKFKIKQIEANKTIIITEDSITVNGKNKFDDVENLWEFPHLNVGTNIIKLSRENVGLKIKYNPMYI